MPTSITRRSLLCQCATIGVAAALGSVASGPLARSARAADKPRIKIGQIGVGHAHATKLSVYRKSADYEAVGIAEPDRELRERASANAAYRDLPWMTEEQLLSTPGLQAVLVETRVRDLLPTAARVIAAGKHVHLDKPAGQSLRQYRELLAAAERQRLMVQMGYMFRYSPAVVLMRKFLAEGWLGDVFEVHTVMSKVVPAAGRRELAEYPGGIMFELGCHVIDLAVGVLGRPERVAAFPRRSSPQDDGLVDNMLAVLEYPRATATVKSSALEVDGGSRRHFVVCGRSGTFHIQPLDAPNVVYTLDRDRGEYRRGRHEIKFGSYERYVGDAADMARILRGEKECDFSYEHDMAVQETVLRASGLEVA
jgi:predicted dehydrogenase